MLGLFGFGSSRAELDSELCEFLQEKVNPEYWAELFLQSRGLTKKESLLNENKSNLAVIKAIKTKSKYLNLPNSKDSVFEPVCVGSYIDEHGNKQYKYAYTSAFITQEEYDQNASSGILMDLADVVIDAERVAQDTYELIDSQLCYASVLEEINVLFEDLWETERINLKLMLHKAQTNITARKYVANVIKTKLTEGQRAVLEDYIYIRGDLMASAL